MPRGKDSRRAWVARHRRALRAWAVLGTTWALAMGGAGARTLELRAQAARSAELERALVQAERAAERLDEASERSARSVRSYLLTDRAVHLEDAQRASDALAAGLERLAGQDGQPAAREAHARVEVAAAEAVRARQADGLAGAARVLEARLEPAHARRAAALQALEASLEARLARVAADAEAARALAFRWMLAVAAGALALALACGLHLARALRALAAEKRALEVHVAERTAALRAANAQLLQQATEDPLTGLLNRRAFDARLAEECARARRYALPLALVSLDVDHFKAINDAYGHGAGDEVLRVLAGVLLRTLRTTDLAARLGGEEFSAILPGTGTEGALQVAERLRVALAGALSHPTPFTVSLGVASWGPGTDTPTALLAAADAALYRSKREGRNRVTLAA